MDHIDAIIKRFDQPDQVRQMERGRFELVTIRGQTFGRATYQPGWKWSQHVGPGVGSRWCNVGHLGYVISGKAVVAFEDGTIIELPTGGLFYVPPIPHDSWVVGDEPYTSLHLLGAEGYAK